MVLMLDLAPDVAQRLQVTAERQGVGIADVVSRLVDTLPDEPVQATILPAATSTFADKSAALEEWTQRHRNAPRVPAPLLLDREADYGDRL